MIFILFISLWISNSVSAIVSSTASSTASLDEKATPFPLSYKMNSNASSPPQLYITNSDGKGIPSLYSYDIIPNASATFSGFKTVVSHASIGSAFSIEPAATSKHHDCGYGVTKTSVSSNIYNCKIAVNGGPFLFPDTFPLLSGNCSGVVVSNATTLKYASNFTSSGNQFGLLRNGSWILGNVQSQQEINELEVIQLVTGFTWLVHQGNNVVMEPGGKRAPRTTVGLDSKGRLVIFEVDGCEDCPNATGPTVQEMALLLVQHDVVEAINMDGGGSSSFVKDGKVRDHPTCEDSYKRCERRVSNILCVRY